MQGRSRTLLTGRSPGWAGSSLGWGPAQIQPARPKAWPCCKGVDGLKPSDAGEGAASPRWVKLGSGQEPTRVGSCPDSASAAEAAPGGKGVAGPKPSDAGEGAAPPPLGEARVGPGAHSGGVPPPVPRFSLRCGRCAMEHGRRQAESEQSKGWQLMAQLSPPGEARVGPKPHSGGVLARSWAS